MSASWATPGSASAHPMLDRAVAAYEEADFELALHTFDTAERNADLSVEELLTLFEMRALVHHALGNDEEMRRDLHRLVAVRGSHQLSRLAPPSVREAFEEMRTEHAGDRGVELLIEEKSIEGSGWMVARLVRAPDGLVDHTTLQCAVDGNARTISRTSRGETVSLRLPESGAHDGCAATARTRQGGVLFSAQVEGLGAFAPRTGSRFSMPKYKSRDDAGKARKKKWPWIVAVSAAVLAGGITAGVLLSQRSSDDGDARAGGVTVNW